MPTQAEREERYHRWLIQCWWLMIESLGWDDASYEQAPLQSGMITRRGQPGPSSLISQGEGVGEVVVRDSSPPSS